MDNTREVWLLKGAIQTGSVMCMTQVQILSNLSPCKNALNRSSLTILFPYLCPPVMMSCTNTSLALQAPTLGLSAELAKTKGRTCAGCCEVGAPVP